MNRIFNLVWSHTLGAWVVASEHAARRRRSGRLRLLAGTLALAPLFLPAADLPRDGRVTLGAGSIGSPAGSSLQIQQNSQKLAIDWQSFDIGAGHSVTFQQPDSSAIALNRVIGSDGSAIHGRLEANGQVFLINPNGILFGRNASVNVGGLVASTLALDNEDFAAGNYRFRSNGNPAGVSNLGSISASDGGAVALLGGQVGNDGIIQARMGTVALAAGKQITLDFAGDGLLSVQIDEAAADALVDNGHLLKADGGTVLMTAQASDALLQTVVNHDGIIEARTLASRDGRIVLQGGPDQGSVRIAGVLDASAPEGGVGGLIETGGATLMVADTAQVTTASSTGSAGTWRIGSFGVTIGTSSGSSISAAALSASLENGNVEVASTGSTAESGDLAVNDAVGRNAGTILSLSASDAVSINADITAGGADADLALNPGSDAGYRLRDGASITLSGSGARFSVNGEAYGVIRSLEALQGIGSDAGGRYVLGNDIDAGATGSWNGGAGFAPIGSGDQPFTGILDGLGHTLSGLTINRTTSDPVGLFGATQGATIRQLGLSEISIAGLSHVGSLVGQARSSTIESVHATGSVSGDQQVGGLAGANASGLIAANYSNAAVSGSTNVGGLVGYNSGSAANSYWDATATAGLPGIGGGNATGASGLGIDRMTQLDSFAGWSISASGSNAIWRIYEGQTTPLLRAFMTPLTVATEDASKTYNGTTWSGGSGYTPGSIRPNFWHRSVRVDDSLIQGAVNTREPARNAGLHALDGGLYSGQLGYDLGYDAGTLAIHKASLTLSASPDSKGYDGSVASSGTVGASGLVAGDTVIATQVFDSADIGERVLLVDRMTIADGNGGNNYEVTRLSASGAVTAAPPRSDRPGSGADSRAVRASAAYLADLASNDPCKSAGQQLSSAEASDCPAASTAVDRQEGSELSYRIENGGMRLPEGL